MVTIFSFFITMVATIMLGGGDNGEKYYDSDNPYLGLAISFHWVQNAVSLQNSEELFLCDITIMHFDLKI